MTLSAPALLTEGASTAGTANYSTASVTPAAGARVVVVFSSGKASGLSEVPTGISHPSIGALTLVRSQAVGNNNQTVSMWTGVSTGVAGAFTATHATAQNNAEWHVLAFTSDVATPTVGQSSGNATATTGVVTSPLPNAVTAGSCVLCTFGINAGSANVPTPGTGYTQLGTTRTATAPTTQQAVAYDNSSPYATPSWSIASTSGRSTMALEVLDGVTTPPAGSNVTVWNGTAEVPATLTVWNGTAEVAATVGLT